MKYFILIFIVLVSAQAFAQISLPIERRSQSLNYAKLQEASGISDFSLPSLDNEQEKVRAKKTKEKQCSDCPNDYFARSVNLMVDLKKKGTKIQLEDGNLWVLKMKSKNAKNLQFFFSEFDIPPGATLHISNRSGDFVLGAFTNINVNPDKRFATSVFPYKFAILEYFEPSSSAFQGRVVINKFAHGFSDFASAEQFERAGEGFGYGESGSCTINIACSQGSFVRNESKAVAMYTLVAGEYTRACTGFLINSTDPVGQKKPYFLTAAHCVSSDASSKTPGYYFDFMFYFNYQSNACENDFGNPLYRAKTFQGAYFRSYGYYQQHSNGSDYALLELYNQPEIWADVAYLGWDRRQMSQTGNVYVIGHPSGDAKKISIGSNPVAKGTVNFDASFNNNGVNVSGCSSNMPMVCWIFNNGTGVTQEKSSGSPMLNANKRVIGVLTGGLSRCADSPDGIPPCLTAPGKVAGPDWGNRMDWLWDHPAIAGAVIPYSFPPVSEFLDATSTGLQFINSYFPPPPQPAGGGGGGPFGDCRTTQVYGDEQSVKLTLEYKNAQRYGYMVSAAGDYFAVSSYAEKSVYLYKREQCSVRLLGKLHRDTGLGYFGYGLDMEGNYMVISEAGKSAGGRVFFYERTDDTWTLVNEVYSASTFYGRAVAVSGENAVIGDPWAGTMNYYRRIAGQWTYVNSTNAPWNERSYGESLDLTGNRAVTTSEDISDGEPSLYVDEYSEAENSWTRVKTLHNSGFDRPKLSPDGNTIFPQAGNSIKFVNDQWVQSIAYPNSGRIATSGDYALFYVGAYTTKLFRKNASTGNYDEWGSLTKENDQWPYDVYGRSVAIGNGYIIVGSSEDATGYICNDSGAAYVYDILDRFTTNQVVCFSSNVPRAIVAKNIEVNPNTCLLPDLTFYTGNYNYEAVSLITLKPGFKINSGVTFRAAIKGCNNFNNGYLNQSAGRIRDTQKPSQPVLADLNPVDEVPEGLVTDDESEVKIYPNPVTQNNFKIYALNPVSELNLFTPQGKEIEFTAQGSNTKEVEVQFTDNQNGLVVVKIVTAKKTIYKKVVVR